MLAYIDPPFFYLPFKSGKAGAYTRLVFADNLTANDIIVGVYDSSNRLIACSHYVTPQQVYVLNTDIVSRRSNVAYNFEMIEVPYLRTGYIADYTYRNKKYLLLPNGKYYIKIIRIGGRYVPNTIANKYVFIINEHETLKQVKEIFIPSLLNIEHIEVQAESRTECLENTALIERKYGAVEKTETMDENTYRTTKWNSYITNIDVTSYNEAKYYELRTYVDITYHLFNGNTDVGIIGRKRLNFYGHPLNRTLYTSEKNANDEVVELTRYYTQGTDDIVDYYSDVGFLNKAQYASGNGHNNTYAYMLYAVASSEIYSLSCDTSYKPVTLGYMNSVVTRLIQPDNTCTWESYAVDSSSGSSLLRVYDTETESFLYTVDGMQNKGRYSTLSYNEKIQELDHWFSQTFDLLRVSINKIFAGEYYSPDFYSRHNESGALPSITYDTNIIRDITNDYTTTVYHTISGTDDDEYYEFRFNNLMQTAPAYYWHSDYEPTQSVTVTQACEYIQPIEWGEYDEIRFNLNNWNKFIIYKNFIRNYAIQDVPLNEG